MIFYHLKIPYNDEIFLKGGYLGVDIFFVISGYLITSIILREIKFSNNFSFLNFYERRIRRLLPVLIFVVLVSIPLGWKYILPTSSIEFSKSIIYSLFFSSNFYFYFTGLEYIQEDALLKPFLHTWSLAVEEQFYILFPVIFFLTFKYFKKYLIHLLITLFLLSFFSAVFLSENYQSSTFYFIHSRIWELLAGSILSYFEIKNNSRSVSKKKNIIFQFLGLFLIISSIIIFDDKINHPSYLTLFPVIGVSLIIWFSNGDEILTKILSSKILVSIGLISYSLYIWHYPIFAFGRLQQQEPNLYDKMEWLVATIIFSIITYFFIEKPFRKKNKIFNVNKIKALIPIFLVFIISVNIYNIYKKGFPQRQLVTETFLLDKRSYAINDHYKFRENYSPEPFTPNSSKKNILIVGNSYGEDFLKLFELNKELFDEITVSLISSIKRHRNLNYEVFCLKDLILNQNVVCNNFDFTKNILDQYKKSEIIIFSSHWNKNDLEVLDEIIKLVKKDNKKIIITSHSLESKIFMPHSFNLLDSVVFEKRKIIKEDLIQIEKEMYTYIDKLVETNAQLQTIASNNNVKFLDQQKFQCNHLNKSCNVMTPDGFKIYWDFGHYTSEGAKYLGNKIFNENWLDLNFN